ncbi:unnamed protein product [Enterobius vermicularis]|uniref:Bet_v_1 domain-containing protein n=1 Tax=Enterobius vermicularis TaxID=51028 RepID=A0A0N4V632_ENTVE|nr:unnamed protein product [Enterobius vermicularis]
MSEEVYETIQGYDEDEVKGTFVFKFKAVPTKPSGKFWSIEAIGMSEAAVEKDDDVAIKEFENSAKSTDSNEAMDFHQTMKRFFGDAEMDLCEWISKSYLSKRSYLNRLEIKLLGVKCNAKQDEFTSLLFPSD